MNGQDKPVADLPVRLVIRYSNGIMQSGVARAVAMKGTVLRVTTREQYETGWKLTAMAAFLPATTPAIVGKVARGTEPGTWTVDLTLRPVAPSLTSLNRDIQEGSPAALRATAASLASRLDLLGPLPYRKAAFDGATEADRGLRLAATELAVYALLETIGLASKEILMHRLRKG